MPLVSVLLPIKGECPYLLFAIQSVRLQSFADWELVICRDLIDDSSGLYLEDLVNTDTRIKVVDTTGLALPSALNFGLDKCTGEFIARFDADDIMLPGRLKNQVLFLQKNPDYIVCGGQIVIIDENQKLALSAPYYNLGDRSLKRKIQYKCPFPHPASLIRAHALRSVRGYAPQFKFAEDYELWLRLSSLGKFANLMKPMIAYRVYESQTSALFRVETRLHMASALIEKLRDERTLLRVNHSSVTEELIQKQYLSLDERNRAIVNEYYRKDSFIADLWQKSGSIKANERLLSILFKVISTVPRKLTHVLLRLLVSVYSLITIRPIWKSYLTTLGRESASGK